MARGAAGAGKVAPLAWIDDADGETLRVQVLGKAVLIAAGGFADDGKRRGERLDASAEIGKASGVIGDGEDLVENSAIDGRRGDIGSEIDTLCVHEMMGLRE